MCRSAQSIGHQLRCELFVSQGANLPFASPAPNPPISSLLKGNKSCSRCGLSEKSPVLNTSGAYMVIELGLALGALILLNIPTSLMQREDETD